MSVKWLQGGGRAFVFLKRKEPEHIYMLKKEASKEGDVDKTTKGGD